MAEPHIWRGVVFLAALVSTATLAAPDEAILGKAEGSPVCPLPQGPTEQRCLVGMLSHYDEIVPARKVAKPAAPRALQRAANEPPISYTFRGQAVMVDPATKVVVVHTAVHGQSANDPSRAEQFGLFFGVVNLLK